MTRAIAYLRVSTRGQSEHGMGLRAQRERVTRFAEANGYQLLEVVQEAASGAVKEGELFSHEHRPILSRLIDRAARGEYDVLLVSSFDRLSRDYLSLVAVKRLLRNYGAQAVSATEGENGNGDAVGELMGQIIAAISEFERKRILERIRAGKAEKRKRGETIGGPAPYGYRFERQEGKPAGVLAIAAGSDSADVVRSIFEAAKRGETPGQIADVLNRRRIVSPSGRAWNRTTVRNILENPVYGGERYGVKNAHPAIVSRRLWNAAQAALRRRSRG